jgi:hypothetical protein
VAGTTAYEEAVAVFAARVVRRTVKAPLPAIDSPAKAKTHTAGAVEKAASGPVAGLAWDLAKVAVTSPGSRRGPGLTVPSRLGSWTRALGQARETRPGDSAERSADHAAAAAVRDEPAAVRDQPKAPVAGFPTARDPGTPPWGRGRPLSPDERHWHEPRAGAVLGEVRIHQGPVPARWARILGARAFTFGRDVVLGAGEYAPGTQAGRSLLAHELTHVLHGRGAAPVLARVALTAADFDALATSIHAAIGSASSDEELIYVALQKLERDATAITSLKAAYKKLFTTDLVTDLGTRLTGHALGLAQTMLGTRGLRVATAAPTTPAGFEATARAVHAALAARPIDPEGVYAALIPFNRGAGAVAALKTTYQRLFNTDLEADLGGKLTGADLSYALYLLDAPGPASPNTPARTYTTSTGTPVTQLGFGSSPTTAAVAGGTVSAATMVPYNFQSTNPTRPLGSGAFSIGYGYSGALAGDTRWLQFIEREIDVTTAAGTTPLAANVTVGGNTYPLTVPPASPNWVVDSSRTSTPFFDEAHTQETFRDPTSVSSYDAPRIDGIVAPLFTAGVTAITSRAHFDTYLIRDFAPIYHVEFEVIHRYTAPGSPGGRPRIMSSGAASSLPAPLKAALVRRYPSFAYIR